MELKKILGFDLTKAKRYINDPSKAPEGFKVEQGPRGGYYYETGVEPKDIKKPKVSFKQVKNLKIGEKIQINEDESVYHHALKGYEWEYRKKEYGFERRVHLPNPEVLYKYVNGEITNIKFDAPGVLDDSVVPIVSPEESNYSGPDMSWTEEMTRSGKTKEDMYAYHYSNNKIKGFEQKVTCFFDDFSYYDFTDIGYRISIPKGTYIEEYNNEIRIDLEDYPNLKIEQLKPGWSNYKEIKKVEKLKQVLGIK